MSTDIKYTPISRLTEFTGTVNLDDLILISKSEDAGKTNTNYTSQKTQVRNFAGTLSSELLNPLSVGILSALKDLAFMDPVELNFDPNITAFVRKSTDAVFADSLYAISSIHWTNGIIDEIGTVNLDALKAKVTDVNLNGDLIAKVDGQSIYNGLNVVQSTTNGFEIAKINGKSVYGGLDLTLIQSITSKGNDIAKVVITSPSGSTTQTIKNGIEIIPTKADGSNTQVGKEIFRVNDIPVYDNLSVTSLVANSNKLGDPIATVNGQEIKNGINVTKGTSVGSVIANINGTDLRNGIEVAGNTKGDVIANINGTQLRNGVNVDNVYNADNGVKIANIAGTDVYGPGTDISAVATMGAKVADVTTGTGKIVSLFSGEHPHKHLTLAEFDELKRNNSLDPNTYYFTEGRTDNSGYDDVGVVYRYKSTPDGSGCYSWFELWPDGWCVQGGKIPAPNYTYAVKFLVLMADTNYTVNSNGEMSRNYGPTGTCAHFNPITNTYTIDGFTMQTCSHFSHTFWEVKGYYNTANLETLLNKYVGYTKTTVGITNVKQSITGGNSVVGLIVAYAGADTPTGWLLCDGTEVSKSVYPELYAVIGNKFGTSKDESMFILPKLTDERYLQGYVESGKQYDAGLPNITGNIANTGFYGTTQESGALSRSNIWQNSFTPDRANDNTEVYGTLNFNAAGSNSIYGAATTVRPKSLTVRYLICWKATDAGNGGGVIDGTLCKDKVIMSAAATATKLEYTVDNDCLLVIENVGTDFTNYGAGVYVNGSLVASLIDQFGGTYTKDRVLCLIPVKKGSLITLQDIDDPTKKIWTAAATVAFYEYQLKLMNPLIAMPDYDATPTNIPNGQIITDNGWIVTNYDDSTVTALSVFGELRINERKVWSFGWESRDGDNNCLTTVIPVSIGDKVTWIGDTYNRVKIQFYPCKPVPQRDCASYCIETWHDANGNWCRIYSDGWCEQGGKQVTAAANNKLLITLHQKYINTDYTIIATPCGRDWDNDFGIMGNNSNYPITQTSFYVANDLEKGDWIMWETKGWIK